MAEKACAYNIPAVRVDGMDIRKMYEATSRALEHVRSGQGPYFIEAMCYRFPGHSMGDPERYRNKEEVERQRLRDPILTFGKELEEEDEFRPPTNASSAAQGIIDRLSAQRGLIKGRLRVGVEGPTTTIRFNDRHLVEESEIALIKQELCDNVSKPNMRVLLDLKNVRRLSTAAAVMVSDVNRWLRHRGGTMAICRIRPELQEILRVLEVENIPRFGDKRVALAARW